jgi:hypothetical protein
MLKAQVVLDWQTKQILCTHHGKGNTHDLKLFRASKVQLQTGAFWLADSGYQGLQKHHANTELPPKRRRGWKLEVDQKRYNRALAKVRLSIEHVNAKLKVLRILSERYRGHRRRFGLRFNLIARIYNSEIHLSLRLLQYEAVQERKAIPGV